MNFSIFCPVDSRGLDVVETAGFRRNSSNLGTLWVSRKEVQNRITIHGNIYLSFKSTCGDFKNYS